MLNPVLQRALNELGTREHKPIELDSPVPIEELPTPALVIDRNAFSNNLAQMSRHVQTHDKGFRPHAKTHKCPEICRQQLAQGAVGVCAAKVSEAAVLVAAGVESILITSPLTTAAKVLVLRQLLETSDQLAVVVDSTAGLALLEEYLDASHQLGVMIDLDISMGRTGARENDLVLSLLARIEQHSALNFRGFQHYAGHVMHIHGWEKRRAKSLKLWDQVRERLNNMGVTYPVLTGGGTGTYNIDMEVPELTDIQVGSYVFMDEEYRQIGSATGERFDDFAVSLTLLCTAISQPSQQAITLDGGYKAMASETVMPVSDDLAETRFRFAGDEHGVLLSEAALQAVKLGQQVRLVTPHCDPTANLHDMYWIQEADGLIHSGWPISARGCSW
ncbi:MAG: alanine racemase [Pseudomonadota bacterium]